MHSLKLAVLAIAALGCPRLVRAEPAGAQAQVLFDRGIALMDAGKFGEACAAFDASEKLEPTISTLLNQADCRERNGQLATAWGLFLEAERQTRAATDEPTRRLHLVAIEHAAKLEPRLSKLTVNVPAESRMDGLLILRGVDIVDAGAWNHPLPVDGGNHTISARAPNHDTWSTTIEIGREGDSKSVAIPKLKLSPVPIPPRRAKLPFVLGGVAVVALGTALGLERLAERTYDRSKVEAKVPKQLSLWRTANAERYVAQGLAVGGLACAGIAVWRYLRHGTIVESPTKVSVFPLVGSDQAGLQLLGRY